MFKTKATNHTTFGRASVRRFTPRLTLVRRPEPALHDHANDNRAGLRPQAAVPHAAPRLICRWRRDGATGRLVCHWELESGDAASAEPEQPRRAA